MGEFKLRSYQAEALDILDSELKTKQNVLFCAIMGAGKTVTICRLINTYFKESDRRFLILVNKYELIKQFKHTFLTKTDIARVDICCAGLNEKIIDGRIVIATVQSFIGMVDKYQGCDLLVLDEAHNIGADGQYAKVIDALKTKVPSMRILGMTATPYRLGHGMIFGNACVDPNLNFFEGVSHKITYQRLLSEGYLVPLHGKVAHADSLGNDLSTVAVSGDYVLNQLGEIMSREIHLNTALVAIKEYCNNFKHVCVFCCTIDHAERLKNIINQFEPCTTVHSQLTQIERYGNMEAWRSGEVRICTSVNILAEGFDFPPLDCLVFARPTLSARLFVQALGRVLRISDGKESGFLLDLTDNTHRFGTDIDSIRADVPRKVIEGKSAKDMFKFCPQCHVEVHQALRTCDNCGFEWPHPEVVEATEVPEMTDVTFESKEPVEIVPEGFTCHIHHSRKNNKWLGKVTFVNLSIYFCMEDFYTGFAVQNGAKRWKEMGGYLPYPLTVNEFLERSEREFVMPRKLIVDYNGKWPEIKSIVPGTDVVCEVSDDCADVPF